MIKTRFYLDTRRKGKDGTSVLKITIRKGGETAFISLDVRLAEDQWDRKAERVTSHPHKTSLNAYITRTRLNVDDALLRILDAGTHSMSAQEIKERVMEELNPERRAARERKNLFAARFLRFAETKKEGTKGIYMNTYRRMVAYAGKSLDTLAFEDITREWLTGFDNFMARTAPSRNARNINLRNIRAVFNDAIDDEITTFYPFRRFKITPEATAKRSLTIGQLRSLIHAEVEPHVEKYRDMFMLIFYLIGINVADLCRLTEVTADGRIEYRRAKTGRLYSIKVESEAMEIINRYRGSGYLLDILDRYKDHRDYIRRLNKSLQHIGAVTCKGAGFKKYYEPMFPHLTTYYARHTWATTAAELEIPKETIAAALGHGGNTVTDIYIDFNRKKVDEANRRVIDWVLYGKR